MTTPASTEDFEPAERLRRARHSLLAALDDPATPEPQSVTSPTPVRALPDDVGAVVVARAQAGLTPAGPEFPRQPLLKRVAMPSAALAVLDLVLLVVALINGSTTLAVIAAILLVVFGAAAMGSTRYAAADPLRIGPTEQRAIDAAGRWSPSRAWPQPGPQRALVSSATCAAQRIVDTPAWRDGALARSGVALSLAAELDLVEAHAATADGDDRTRLILRIAALLAYADTAQSLPPNVDDLEQADVETLAFFLSGAIYDVT